jgi:drug/metabolite transporter (DMT)-like permease
MSDRATITAFIGFVLIGGVNLVAVRFSNRELPPMFGAGIRFSIAAVLLLLVVSIRRLPVPRNQSLLGAVAYGLLAFTVAYACAYVALTERRSG